MNTDLAAALWSGEFERAQEIVDSGRVAGATSDLIEASRLWRQLNLANCEEVIRRLEASRAWDSGVAYWVQQVLAEAYEMTGASWLALDCLRHGQRLVTRDNTLDAANQLNLEGYLYFLGGSFEDSLDRHAAAARACSLGSGTAQAQIAALGQMRARTFLGRGRKGSTPTFEAPFVGAQARAVGALQLALNGELDQSRAETSEALALSQGQGRWRLRVLELVAEASERVGDRERAKSLRAELAADLDKLSLPPDRWIVARARASALTGEGLLSPEELVNCRSVFSRCHASRALSAALDDDFSRRCLRAAAAQMPIEVATSLLHAPPIAA